MAAEVRISALPRRSTPMLNATVTRVAADATTDEQTGMSYYPITVDVPENELAKLGDHELIAGMPATVMINAGEQTLLEYLADPWTSAIEQSFRER
jgi:multidrug efflux pump subunit AcrA (membrane-fusion protein)